ncbi:MAG: hypothetical protein RIQ79_2395 [Verrucomicrobiota bacterium]|jgi:hypothetical protein
MNPDSANSASRPALKWRFARVMLNRRFATQLARMTLDGYLAEVGWTRSVLDQSIVGRDGSAVPWATYSFIEFIGPRLCKDFKIFEYGSGASTSYYAERVSSVVALEHDGTFAARLRPNLPANVDLWERPLGPEYINAIAELREPPSLVSVDGRNRVACVEAACGRLASDGVLVLDDTERPDYEPACEAMKKHGFKRLDFWGFAPGQVERRCTTVFYRSENVLGL